RSTNPHRVLRLDRDCVSTIRKLGRLPHSTPSASGLCTAFPRRDPFACRSAVAIRQGPFGGDTRARRSRFRVETCRASPAANACSREFGGRPSPTALCCPQLRTHTSSRSYPRLRPHSCRYGRSVPCPRG